MKPILACAAIGCTTPAQAHLGHVTEVAGHGHWGALAALAAAAAIAAAIRFGKKSGEPEEETTDAEPQEA